MSGRKVRHNTVSNLAAQPDAPSDAELISRVRAGDQAAYGELFERHREAAHRMARQLVRGPDIDDLISEAFTKVFVQLQRGGGPDVAFRAYLLTSIRRLHVDRARTNQRVQVTDDLEDLDRGVDFVDPATSSFERGAASRAFTSLPERWQLVLWHLEVEGQKPADIAPLLGMSPNSVAALAYRAREGLRQAYLQSHLADTADEGCRWTTEHLGAYVRKGLAKRDSAKVENHLHGCHRCTAVYLELTEVNSNLSGLLAPALLGLAAPGYLAASGTKLGLLLLWPWTKLKEAGAGAQAGAAAAAVAAVVAVAAVAGVLGGGGDDTDEASEPSTQQTAPEQTDSAPDNQQENSQTSPDEQTPPDRTQQEEQTPPDEDDPPESDASPDEAPATPTDVTGRIRGSNVVLRWGAVDDARGYRVYRRSSPAASPTGVTAAAVADSGAATASTTPAAYAISTVAYPAARAGAGAVVSNGVIQQTSFRDASLVDGNEYRYVVTAVGGGEESPVSEPVTVTYNPEPSTPRRVRARERDAGVALRWASNPEPDIGEYRILRDGRQIGTSSSARFKDDSAIDGSTYAYAVVALDRSGQESDESRSVDATYDPAPDAPAGLSAEEKGRNTALSWKQSTEPDIDSYNVYRDGEKIASVERPRYVDTDSPDGATTYTVTAIDASAQESAESDDATVDADPRRPRGADARPVDNGIEVTWERSTASDLDHYRVLRDGAEVATTRKPRYVDAAAVDGSTYTYRIVAVDDAGNESRPSRTTRAPYDPAPDAPDNLTATVRGDKIVLRWSRNGEPDLDGYLVYRDGERITKTTSRRHTYIDKDLTDGATYTYTVRAIDRSDQKSTESAPATATYDPAPDAPTDLVAIEAEGGIRLDWQHRAQSDVTGYVVVRTENTTGDRTTFSASLVTAYVDYTAEEGTSYTYTVYAVDASGRSDKSNEATGVWTSPSAPAGLQATGRHTMVALTWRPNGEPDVDGYIVYRDGIRLGTTSSRSATSFKDKSAIEGEQYRYNVAAVDRAGNESDRSAADTAGWDGKPPKPSGLTWRLTGTVLHFEWNGPTHADFDHYEVHLDGESLGPTTQPRAIDPGHTGRYTHTLTVTAVDVSGKKSNAAKLTFTHDDADVQQRNEPRSKQPARMQGFTLR